MRRHAPAGTRQTRRRDDVAFPIGRTALIVCAGILTYWNSLDGPFIWDDRTAIVNNPTIRSFWPPWDSLIPPLETPVARRPIVNMSFALNYALDALDVTGYHALNLGVHLLAACLLFGIVRRALAGDHLRDAFGAHASNVALMATLWWALHPMLSEVVNYTTQRTTSMAGLFFLGTLYAAQRGLGSPHRGRWHAAAVLACALGMAAKETVAAAPLVVVLYDRIFAYPTFRQALAARRYLYGALAVTWIPLGALLALRPHSTIGFSTGVTPWTYLLNQAQMVPHYLRLAVWPDALVLDYGMPRMLSLGDVAGGVMVMGALLTATLVALVRWPAIGFLGATFFLTLAPSSSIVPIATEVGAERRMYLPLAAVAVLGAIAGTRLLAGARARLPARLHGVAAAVVLVLAGAWLTALTARTVHRNEEFDTRQAIWRTSVERWPHGRARLSYATALLDAGEDDLALRQLRLAVRDYPRARFALGNQLAAEHKYDEAVRELSVFIRLNPRAPNRIPARTLRGQIFAEQGRIDEALDEFRALVTLFPSNLVPRERLAELLLSRGQDHAEAASHYRVLVNARPNHTGWLTNLGAALATTGRSREAADAYRSALGIDPSLTSAHVGLAGLLLTEGRTSEAAAHAETAIGLDPRDATAHNVLGIVLAMGGRFAEAIAHFEAALDIEPGYQEARDNLVRAQGLSR